MGKPMKVKELESLARERIGGNQGPNLYFVTDQGVVVTVSRSLPVAYKHWQELAQRRPRVECALEDRSGVLASVESHEEDASWLVVHDDVPENALV